MYLAERVGSIGWSTLSLQPPPLFGITDFSSGMEYAAAGGLTGATKWGLGSRSTGKEFLLHRVDLPNVPANWEVFGDMVLTLVGGGPFEGLAMGASGDLCHQILGRTDPLLADAMGTIDQIYDQSRGCRGGEPYLRLVGVNNAGNAINPGCEVELGLSGPYSVTSDGSGAQRGEFNAISSDGNSIFFTANVEKKSALCRVHQLFVRVAGEKTVEVSKPLAEVCSEVPCPGAGVRASAYFKGASEDGSHVFFTTTAPLVEGDKDTSNDLYLARMDCGEGEVGCGIAQRRVMSLVQVSHDPTPGQDAGVVGVVRIAPDGSRVYFVAHGVLSEGPNVEGHTPVNGADNLYVYDTTTGMTVFVTNLCSGPVLSGSAKDLSCPADLSSKEDFEQRNDTGLWGNVQEAQSTRDGRVLVFSSYGQLLEDDADTARDVYRYDAAAGSLVRVSVGEDSYDANGNHNGFDAGIEPDGINPGTAANRKLELGSRAVSDDGSRIVFTTTGSLSPRAVNGLDNVYEWHGGDEGGVVSILSGGSSLTADAYATISPSGRDVFFVTAEGLVPGDTDGLRDIYDTRIGGGFPETPTPRQSCSSDACQGPLTNPTPLLVPASTVQTAGENFPSPAKKKAIKKRAKRKTNHARGNRRKGMKASAWTGRNNRGRA
jgi:hypothetical protein